MEVNDKIICIYHKNCFDGMAAAWVVRKKFEAAELIPMQYGEDTTGLLQDCYENANINTHYILVDFSLPRDLMILMHSKAKSMVVLDHHKTAQAACEGLDFCLFEMNESGASLAWRHFFPDEARPELIQYVADRDLWQFKLPNSNYINAFIQSFPMSIEAYDNINFILESNTGFEEAISQGRAIERYKASMVDAHVKNIAFKKIGQYYVPVVNATLLFSEIGHELCKMYPTYPFAAAFFIRNDDMVQYSLRSIGDFDVAEVAKSYGGGGHKNAAGFQVNSNRQIL